MVHLGSWQVSWRVGLGLSWPKDYLFRILREKGVHVERLKAFDCGLDDAASCLGARPSHGEEKSLHQTPVNSSFEDPKPSKSILKTWSRWMNAFFEADLRRSIAEWIDSMPAENLPSEMHLSHNRITPSGFHNLVQSIEARFDGIKPSKQVSWDVKNSSNSSGRKDPFLFYHSHAFLEIWWQKAHETGRWRQDSKGASRDKITQTHIGGWWMVMVGAAWQLHITHTNFMQPERSCSGRPKWVLFQPELL